VPGAPLHASGYTLEPGYSSAFDNCGACRSCPATGFYVHAGSLAFQRDPPANRFITLLHGPDPSGFQTFDTTVNVDVVFKQGKGKGQGEIMTTTVPVTVNVTVPVFEETADPAPAGSPGFGDYHDMGSAYAWGVVGGHGYRCGTGFG